jgi:hypothetical protein
MLEQSQDGNGSPNLMTFSLEIPGTLSQGPISVSAPRAAAVSPPSASPHSGGAQASATHGPTRLADLVARAEGAIQRLEAQLVDERGSAERAARATVDIDERLRLGVRMLQAFDVQLERGESSATRAKEAIAQAEASSIASMSASISETVARLVETQIAQLAPRIEAEVAGALARAQAVDSEITEKLRTSGERVESLARELDWRFDRVGEVESRLEQAANSKLAWLDGELAQRAERLAGAVADAESRLSRSESILARLDGLDGMIERAERATAALGGLSADSERQIEALAQRTGDASALREALGTLVHEISAAREVVSGEIRRMRDDLGWLVEKGERVGGELVERADRAAACSDEIRSAARETEPVVAELRAWRPILEGDGASRVQGISDSIAASVRDELASDMRGFAAALRQLAARADGAFAHIRVDPSSFALKSSAEPCAAPATSISTPFAGGSNAPGNPSGPSTSFASGSELARAFATELGRLEHSHAVAAAANSGAVSMNQPVELDIAEPAFPAGTPVSFGSRPASVE